MSHDEILKSMMQYGFSAVIAVYVLVRMEARLQQLADAITQLKGCMEVKTAKFEEAIRQCERERDLDRGREYRDRGCE